MHLHRTLLLVSFFPIGTTAAPILDRFLPYHQVLTQLVVEILHIGPVQFLPRRRQYIIWHFLSCGLLPRSW